MKKQINVRLSEPGQQRLAELSQIYGSQTMAVEMAIERLYREEVIQMTGPNVAAQIAQSVVENGRVQGEGDDWLESLEVEVEFEAREQGYENSDEIAREAVSQSK